MRTIYVVESGEYSDYRVHGAFETREAAEAAISLGYGNNDRAVLEMMLYEGDEQPIVGEEVRAYQMVRADGSTDEMRIFAERSVYDPGTSVEAQVYGGPVYGGPCAGDHTFSASGIDREAVIKSVADRVAKKRAEILGL